MTDEVNYDNVEYNDIGEDRGDLLFALRKNNERVSQLFSYANQDLSKVENAFDRKMMKPDEMELRVAKQIIEREKKLAETQKSAVSNNILPNDSTKKRPITEISGADRVNAITKRPMSGTDASNSILSKLYSNQRNNLTSKTSVSRWQGVETVRMIGNSLVDTSKLLKNAPVINQNKPNLATPANNNNHNLAAKKVQASQDTKLMSEIDELLSKKSSHNHEADQEWFDQYSKKCDRLAKQEYIADKKAQLTHVTIQAHECITCNHFVTEFLPNICKQQGHQVIPCVAVKRFFLCRNCPRRDFTLCKESIDAYQRIHMPPQRRCTGCGANDWVAPTGAISNSASATGGSNKPPSREGTLQDERLILSASEWSTSRDKLMMASKVCNLK